MVCIILDAMLLLVRRATLAAWTMAALKDMQGVGEGGRQAQGLTRSDLTPSRAPKLSLPVVGPRNHSVRVYRSENFRTEEVSPPFLYECGRRFGMHMYSVLTLFLFMLILRAFDQRRGVRGPTTDPEPFKTYSRVVTILQLLGAT